MSFTIFIVDDDLDSLDFLAGELLPGEGYSILLASSAEQALEIAGKHTDRIDLLLTDVKLPGMSGPELVQKFRTIHPESHILYMSGYAQEFMARYTAMQDVEKLFISKNKLGEDLIPRLRELLKPEHKSAGPSKVVLVVDDDRKLVKILSDIIADRGYTVVTATSGPEALEMAAKREYRIDLLLTDLIMTPMNGPDLAEELQRNIPELKVIYMSGYSEQFIKNNTTRTDIVFLMKPVMEEVLISKINDLLVA